jgi:hypothetical protein
LLREPIRENQNFVRAYEPIRWNGSPKGWRFGPLAFFKTKEELYYMIAGYINTLQKHSGLQNSTASGAGLCSQRCLMHGGREWISLVFSCLLTTMFERIRSLSQAGGKASSRASNSNTVSPVGLAAKWPMQINQAKSRFYLPKLSSKSSFLPELQNRVNHLLPLLKCSFYLSDPVIGDFQRRFYLYLFYLFRLNFLKIIVNHKKS